MSISAAGAVLAKLASIVTNSALLNVINGSRGTQVTKSAIQNGAGTTIIHTVTTAKTLYLTGVTLDYRPTGSSDIVELSVRNAGDTDQYKILELLSTATAIALATAIPFPYPIAIPAGYDVFIKVTNAGTSNAFIHGWEE